MYFVYILQSEADHKLYVGMTSNLENRLAYHNAGKVRSTKHRTPFRILHSESYATQKEAREREVHLKSYSGSKEKMSIVKSKLNGLIV